jgi:hypothetical protein
MVRSCCEQMIWCEEEGWWSFGKQLFYRVTDGKCMATWYSDQLIQKGGGERCLIGTIQWGKR